MAFKSSSTVFRSTPVLAPLLTTLTMTLAFGITLGLSGCSKTETVSDSTGSLAYQMMESTPAGFDALGPYDYRVVVDTTKLLDEKELASTAAAIYNKESQGSKRIDTLFFYLPNQLVLLGSYGFVEFKDGKPEATIINGERVLVCSDWHPYIKANDRRCDIYESEYLAGSGIVPENPYLNQRAPQQADAIQTSAAPNDLYDPASEPEPQTKSSKTAPKQAVAKPKVSKKSAPVNDLPQEGV